jgi:cytochrome c oxidase assembly factor 2
MPPALHPKSTQTLSLFTTTLVLGFTVVTLPHIFPCPVDHRRKVYADGEHPERRRRRRAVEAEQIIPNESRSEDDSLMYAKDESKRECPVPKPTGLIGRVLGFKDTNRDPNTVVTVEIESGREGRR